MHKYLWRGRLSVAAGDEYEEKAPDSAPPGHRYCGVYAAGFYEDVKSRLGAAGQSLGPLADVVAYCTIGLGHADRLDLSIVE
jgi:hypothetical protein